MEEKLQIRLYPNSEPHKFQKQFHYYANKKEIKFIILVFPRQQGKTECLLAEVSNKVLKKPGISVLWVTPVESQSVLQFEKLCFALEPFILTTKRTHGQFEIVLKNNSRIYFKPASSQSIRGMTINLLVIDEMQDVMPDDLNSNILPVMIANKGNDSKVFIAGTPKGVTSNFYKWFRRESLNYAGYKSIHMQEWLNPKTDVDFIMGQKEVIPDKQWRAEYKAEWVSGEGFFSNIPEQNCIDEIFEPVEGIKYFAAADIGIQNDATAISVCNEFGEQVHVKILKKTNSPEIKRTIKQIQADFNIVFWTIERNNQGLPVIQDLIMDNESPMFNIHSFSTDYKSKGELLNALENKLAKKSIKLLNRQDVINEMADFECRLLPNGKYRFSAPLGKNDDIVIATALNYFCLDKYNKSGEYCFSVV